MTLLKNPPLPVEGLPEEVRCGEMVFTVPGKCLAPLDHNKHTLLMAALKPVCLDWKHPQRDRRGFEAWVYHATDGSEPMMVAVVLDDQRRLLKLRGLTMSSEGGPSHTLVYATFSPPTGTMGLKPPIGQRLISPRF